MSRDGDVASFRRAGARNPNMTPLQSSINRHPASSTRPDNDPLADWTDTLDQISRGDVVEMNDRKPKPNTVRDMGKLIVDIAGPDKTKQIEIARAIAEIAGLTKVFADKYLDVHNVGSFVDVVDDVVRESVYKRDNDKQGE